MNEAIDTRHDEPALVRLFVAVAIDEKVRQGLGSVQSELKRTHAHVSWVKPPNLHLSLAFLGNQPREKIEELRALLDEVVRDRSPFELTIRGVDAFGSERSPRIVWAGADDSEPLAKLHAQLCEGLTVLGYEVDSRPFAAHLTLGRVRSSRGRIELARALATLRDANPVFGTQPVTAIRLYRSLLSAQGPTYLPLHAAPLHGTTPPGKG